MRGRAEIAEAGKATRFKKGDPRTKEASSKGAAVRAANREVILTAKGLADYVKQKYGVTLSTDLLTLEKMNEIKAQVLQMPVDILKQVVVDTRKENSTLSGLVAAYGEERLKRLEERNTDDIEKFQNRAFGRPALNLNANVMGLDAPRGFDDDE